MNDIERAIDVQQKLIKKWENRAKELEEVIEKHPWGKMGYESADWRELELKRRKEQILTALIIISALEKQLNGGWIPVSERLPEQKFIDYLITTEKGEIYTSQFYGYGEECQGYKEFPEGVWQIDEYGETVIAWQPLPEPYKEVENE